MTLEQLANLARIGELKAEKPDQTEFDGMVPYAPVRVEVRQLRGRMPFHYIKAIKTLPYYPIKAINI